MNSPAATIVRPDLSRFGIYHKVPAGFAQLVIDLFTVSTGTDAKAFIDRVSQLITPQSDLSGATVRFLFWMLNDPQHGVVRITKRADVMKAVLLVAHNIILPLVHGTPLMAKQFKAAVFTAEAAQENTWNIYQQEPSLAHRTEWMIASAAVDVARSDEMCSLVSAVHCAALAWSASNGLPGQISTAFYDAARDQVLAILAPPPSEAHSQPQIVAGTHVAFDDAHDGPQTGVVHGIIDVAGTATTALVEVDHSMPGITWNVPVADLSVLVPASA